MRPVNVLTMILAGGIGERLYPLTANRSKPSVPFGGNFRIIDFTMMNCVLSGLRSIHLLTQYHSLSLGRHKNARWNFFSPELGEFVEIVPPKLRTATGFYHGTADAIYRNLDLLDRYRPDVVLVLSGDHVYRADYRRFIDSHLESDADVTVLTDRVDEETASSFGVLRLGDGGTIERFVEKPKDPGTYAVEGKCQINLGVYCFQTKFLVERLISDSKRNTAHDFGKNILPRSVEEGRVSSCPLEAICPDPTSYWRDVGTIDGYFESTMDLLRTPPAFDLRDSRWPPGSRFFEWLPAKFPGSRPPGDPLPATQNLISSGCEVTPSSVDRSVLSPGVHIGQGSEIEECIIFSGVNIGKGVKMRRVIVDEGVHIPDGAEIRDGVHCGQFTSSPSGVVVVASGYRFDEPNSPKVTVTRKAARKPAASRKSRKTKSRPAERTAS